MNFIQVLRKNGFLSKNLIYNKSVLYLILIIALTNLFFIFQQNDMFSILVFFLIGFLTTFFSKNMIVILCMCIFFTNVLKYGRSAAGHHSVEGFDEKTETKDDADKEKNTTDNKKKAVTPVKEEKAEPEKPQKDSMVLQQEKLLENMNKYKSLLETLQGITENMKELKGGSSS